MSWQLAQADPDGLAALGKCARATRSRRDGAGSGPWPASERNHTAHARGRDDAAIADLSALTGFGSDLRHGRRADGDAVGINLDALRAMAAVDGGPPAQRRYSCCREIV